MNARVNFISFQEFLFLLFGFLCITSVHSQSNPAEIFSGVISTAEPDSTSDYWIGNRRYRIKSISLGHDNDLFGIAVDNLNKDESYTGGFQLQLTMSPIMEKIFFRFQKGNGKKGEPIKYPQTDSANYLYINNISKFELGAQAYTPFDLESTEVVEEDRPYGSFHYLSFGLNSTILRKKDYVTKNRKKRISKRMEKGKLNPRDSSKFVHRIVDSQIYIGTIGGYAAPIFQSWTHRFLKRETPNGWHNQISGEKRRIAINYRVSNRFLAVQTNLKSKEIERKGLEKMHRTFIFASIHAVTDFNLGSYATNLAIGTRLHLLEWNRGARSNLNMIKKGEVITPGSKPPKLADNWNFYVYGQALARAIVFDDMLQGTLFNDFSVHTIDYRQINPIRYDFSMGIAWGIWKKLSIYLDADYRSQEFLGGKNWHLFSRIGINVKLD